MRWVFLGILAAALVALTLQVGTVPAVDLGPCPFELVGGHFTLVDEADGTTLLETGRVIGPADAFVAPDNRLFRVHRIDGTTAYARHDSQTGQAVTVAPADGRTLPVQQGASGPIGIYHSHSSESYVPSDGADSIDGRGGILDVGGAFASALEDQGLAVDHRRTSHDPHDAGSYVRSRRTASELAGRDSVALFDVHRDTAPPETYRAEVGGRTVAQVLLVVGTQNPRFQENLAFAQQLKAAADERHPGLVRGILKSGSDFNQDLMPQSVILEVGAHENDKGEAIAGVELLAQAIPDVVDAAAPGGAVSRAAWRTAAWFIGAAVVGAGLYFYLSSGSLEEAVDKARASVNPRVWADRITGRIRRRR